MFPEDVEFLFERVRVSTVVRIIDVPVKLGWDGEALVAEVHPLLEVPPQLSDESAEQLAALDADVELPEVVSLSKDPLTHVTEQFIKVTAERPGYLDWDRIELLVEQSDGIPAIVGSRIKNAATSAATE
jgi:L,D-transpeptidase ErfK/SrfK